MSSSPAPAPGQPSAAAPEAVEGLAAQVATTVKPHLRGWIHAGVAPIVLVASIVLVILSPTPEAKWSTAVFGLTAVMLFGTSAV